MKQTKKAQKKSMEIIISDMNHLIFFIENVLRDDFKKYCYTDMEYVRKELKRIHKILEKNNE